MRCKCVIFIIQNMQFQISVCEGSGTTPKKLDCQTFRGYAFRRGLDFQLEQIEDPLERSAAEKLLKKAGGTNEDLFRALQEYIAEKKLNIPLVLVTPIQAKTAAPPTIEDHSTSESDHESNLSSLPISVTEHQIVQRMRLRRRQRRFLGGLSNPPTRKTIVVRREPKIIPLPPLGEPLPKGRARWFRRTW